MEKRREINYGICMMRLIYGVLIVCFHFHASWDYYPGPYIFLREMPVAIFLLIAFYLGEPVLVGDNREKKLARMKRLFVPYLFWGVISWIFNLVMEIILNLEDRVTLSDLFWQVATGCVEKVNPPMYFLWLAMLFTLFFIILFKVMDMRVVAVLLMIASFVCLWIEYDGRATIFFRTLRYEIMYSAGRIYELIPFAIFGIVIAMTHLVDQLKKHRALWCILLTIVVPILLYFRDPLFPRTEQTLAFSGSALFVVSPIIFLWMMILPFEKLPKVVKRFIETLSSYSMGVISIHWPLGMFINMAYKNLTGTEKTLTMCFIIYLVSWIISFLIGLIPGKLSKMLVK
ncbi:MAG: acyltransferase [Lachnospiraceae bacterium]|nr:acyltransferase [Lachnospiraceae bacterium]